MNIFGSFNNIATSYEPLINALNSLFSLFISIGLFLLARQAHRISVEQHNSTKYKINSAERKIFRSNYNTLCDALDLVLRSGRIDETNMDRFRFISNNANLELPLEIQEYTKKLYELAWEAYKLNRFKMYDLDGNAIVHEDRANAVQRHYEIIDEIIKQKPSLIYSKYMKIKL